MMVRMSHMKQSPTAEHPFAREEVPIQRIAFLGCVSIPSMLRLLVVFVLSFAVNPGLFARETVAPLNIVLFVVDDLGWTDLGCYGSSFYETTNVDRLAAEGMRFLEAYAACPVCSPTRAAIMTGKWPQRLGITDHLGAPQPDAWKLIDSYEDDSWELFHLAEDIGETRNLIVQYPEKAAELRKLLEDWLSKVQARYPTVNPNYEPGKPDGRIALRKPS